ncbi:MAG: phospholipase D family protein [Gammaproteobacteria bacterium]|nr:phospholipase D family protein [Gammaproteobacteria bacterium]
MNWLDTGWRRALAALCVALSISGCMSLPRPAPRAETSALAHTEDTVLGKALRARVVAHPGTSGFLPLIASQDAFAARMLAAKAAERSLDVQYYIWHGDTTGQLLWEALWQAAERGVRVRLLLDDNNTPGLDATLAALDAHPLIEVRLFNPFANRQMRLADFAFDFSRVNQRMHNKSFTADNQVTIVGGRNVGDEYFGGETEVGFQDLDVLAIGPVVKDVSSEFDRYWNDEAAYPVAALLAPADASGVQVMQENWKAVRQRPGTQRYLDAVAKTPLMTDVEEDRVAFDWAPAKLLSDAPAKIRSSPDRHDLRMFDDLEDALGHPHQQLDLISPYFVPGDDGARSLDEIMRRGVKLRILTNSMAATDVAAVHAGYARYRTRLLKAGALIYELKASAPAEIDTNRRRAGRRGSASGGSGVAGGSGGGSGGVGGSGVGGSSTASLHAKAFEVDRRRVFVGSLNLDPRSVELNTEMGLVIDSAPLAGRLSDEFDTRIPEVAYEVRLKPDGTLEWVDRTPEGEVHYAMEPDATIMKRFWVRVMSLLPIEWLL